MPHPTSERSAGTWLRGPPALLAAVCEPASFLRPRALVGSSESPQKDLRSNWVIAGNPHPREIATVASFRTWRIHGHASRAPTITTEWEGFEPPVPFGTLDFESSAFDHSATTPGTQGRGV